MIAPSVTHGSVDLVVFTAAGRGALLERTVGSLRSHCNASTFRLRILSVDGYDPELMKSDAAAWFDRVVVSSSSAGYFHNILQGVQQVEAGLFLWMEDDWQLTAFPTPGEVQPLFASDGRLAQIRWPKYSYLLIEDKRLGRLAENVWIQGEFFSLNPHYARTTHVREAIADVTDGDAAGQNVEVAFSRALRKRGCVFGVWEPGFAAAVHEDQPKQDSRSHYRAHEVPLIARQPTALPAGSFSQGKTPSTGWNERLGTLVSRTRLSEYIAKGGFALVAVLLSVLMVPFSRQARAFVRTVWWYWLPVPNSPAYLGETRYDAGGSRRGNRSTDAAG